MNVFLKFFLFFSLLIGLFFDTNAQYFQTGQDPVSIKWKQINTEDFQIIFPEGYEKKAKYMAAIFQDLLSKGGKDLQHQPKKFSVVVHAHSATSNGLVAWAPKRMEIYNTSSPDNDSQLWIDHVSTHEYRHVIQIDKMEQGFTKFLNFVFGQQATMAVVGLYLPPWFLEGDAVCTETALSESGRGRLPSFEQELRAQLIEKGNYSYDKAVNGSYKDFVTDRYKLGYYLVGKSRVNYSDALWETTLNRVANRPHGITTFAKGLNFGMTSKRDAIFDRLSEKQKEILAQGINVKEFNWTAIKNENTRADGKLMLYYDIMKELEWEWSVQDAKCELSNHTKLSSREKVYTNRRFPHVDENGDIIVLNEGLSEAAYFEIINSDNNNNNSNELFVPGYNFNSGFDYKKGKLIWSERRDNIRWEHADKSVLTIYDTKRNQRNVIKAKNNLFAPSFSPSGMNVVAVESDNIGSNQLVIIDEKSGVISKRFIVGENEFIQSPQWKDQNSIVFILLNHDGKQLIELDLESGQMSQLVTFGKQNIYQLEPSENHLFFTAAFTGIDNVFAFEYESGKVFQVISSRFGARDPHVKNDLMYYADYTSDGYLPVKMELNKLEWIEWNESYYPYPLAEQLSDQIGVKLTPDTTKLEQFEIKKYSKIANLINLHSWAPVFIDGLEQEADIGVSVASQNKLSTLLATVGYKKEQGYQNGQFYANLSYQGWFPIFDSKITVGNRDSRFITRANRISPVQVDTILVDRSLKQWNWENSISLPFNLSSGKNSTRITPKVTYSMVKQTNIEYRPLATTQSNTLGLGEYDFGKKDFTQSIMEYQLFGYNITKTAPRDIQYQWAQILEFNYRHTPFGDRELGKTWSAEAHLYFPGLIKHHGIKLYGGYQNRSLVNSVFSNMIKSPRGMRNLYGKDIFTGGVDYAFPIAYPDWNIGPLAYFKRIKMNLFMDCGYEKRFELDVNNNLLTSNYNYSSFGADLRADVHVLRFPAPLDIGIRFGYEDQSKAVFAKFLLSFNLNSY